MTVYADMVFLLNFCVDFLLLWLTMAIRKQKTAYWRLAVAAVLGACYAVMMLAPVASWVFAWGVKLLWSCLMVFVAFGYRSRPAFLRNWGVFYFTSFVVGGGMFAAHYFLLDHQEALNGLLVTQSGGMGTPVTWTFVVLAFPLVWFYSRLTFKSLAERQDIHHFLVHVEIQIGKRGLRTVGFIDTGNQLRDPFTRTPVMIAEHRLIAPLLPPPVKKAVKERDVTAGLSRLPPEWGTRMKLIPYRSVRRGTDFLLALKPDKVQVVREGRTFSVNDVLIGLDSGPLSSDGTYQMIVHPACVEEAV